MPAQLIRSIYNVTPAHQGGVVTLGNFDGVHLGHQQLIGTAVAQARQWQVPSLAITFEPHAFEYFSKGAVTIPRLTRLREKWGALAACGLDYVLVIPFNQSLAAMSAIDFAVKIVGEALRPRHVIVGDDFHFGRGREGDSQLLTAVGKEHGFSVSALSTVMITGERVSSTRVRQALAQGDMALAETLLGHPYRMQGRVRRGDQRGRQMGFPTANLFLHRQLTPVKGVYTVRMLGVGSDASGRGWPGVANVGQRPTFNGTRTLLEVHLFDFHQEIYGRDVEVEFCTKLRDEVKYDSFDALKAQIAKDVIAAKTYFGLNAN